MKFHSLSAVLALLSITSLRTTGQELMANEPRVFSVVLAGRSVQSPIVPFEVVGTNLTGIVRMAVIVDGSFAARGRLQPDQLSNVKESDWIDFQEKGEVDLGKGEGERQVWFGFERTSGKKHWQRYRVDVDSTPPDLTITNPTNKVVAEPIIQLTGSCPEQITLISLDIKNSVRSAVNLPVSVARRVFDPRQRRLAATEVQCYNLELAPGTNLIAVHATDLAGNDGTKLVTVVLDPSVDTNPPEITIDWPKPDEEVNAKVFRLRGSINEATAKVQVVSATADPVDALVERDGLFWVPNLQLPNELNEFTVVATGLRGQCRHATHRRETKSY